MKNVMDFFPLERPRDAQARCIEEAYEAFESGKKFVLLEGPPGLGKSAAAVTLGRAYGQAFICTLTKQLQRQYVEDFQHLGMRELKGRANYRCEEHDTDCEKGAQISRKAKKSCDECPYQIAKAEALAAPLTVCNYMSYLFTLNVGNGTRPLLVLDEGHETEEVMMNFVSCTVDIAKVPIRLKRNAPDPDDANDCFEWLMDFLVAAQDADVERMTVQQEDDLVQLVKKATNILQIRDAEAWISEPLDKRTGFVIKPLTVKSFGHRLFRHGDRVLIMSATILDPEKLANSLGVDDYAFVSAPCPFPVENRPVLVSGLNMTKAYRDKSWPAMVDQVSAILDAHEKDKGLILTTSIEMLKYLEANLPAQQVERLISAYGMTRQKNYDRHCQATGPTVLIAPGLWEGADLREELSRFQILPAVPRPFWGGQTAARGKMDPRWYRLKTYCQLIQGLGRSVRSETDRATSYVLDGDMRNEMERGDSMIPNWLKEAVEYVG